MIRIYRERSEVILAVEDQGQGIPAEILEKVGTPFFTTKEQGTGLGLAVCFSIAKRHGAKLEIESGPRGTKVLTRFRVRAAMEPDVVRG